MRVEALQGIEYYNEPICEIYSIENQKKASFIGSCRTIKEAIIIINNYLATNNFPIGNYRVLEFNNYTQLKNGNKSFHLYKLNKKGE